ncbi:MAG TPA: hypothetical protein VGQ30_10075 [Gemmatimonadaceae bacterium]|nr:hypothetical protein [Gemmatimonadaceae bacterium]
MTNIAADSDARRLLLRGLVDYAGLFPPAAESMREAVARYDEYRRGPHAWALGKFVVPVARLAEFEDAVRPLIGDAPWILSLIAGADFAADVRAIGEFALRAGSVARIGAIEVKGSSVEAIAAIARNAALLHASIPDAFDVYVEVPVATDPSALIEAIARHGMRAKVRTGGVEAAAFPTAEQLARFFAACVGSGVTFKATAGLHHAMRGSYPLTYDSASARGTMFGFLNVFLAAAFARDGLGAGETAALLEERDANALTFTASEVKWRGRALSADAVRRARASTATSFGSCSFAEPVADLSSIGLL